MWRNISKRTADGYPIGVGMATVFCRCCVTPVKFSFTGDQL